MNRFIPNKTHVADIKWDTDYITLIPHQRIVKTGEGEEDFVVETYYTEQRKPIAEVIAVDADSASLSTILSKYFAYGDQSLIDSLKPNGDFVDLTEIPDNLIDLEKYASRIQQAYQSLPEELVAGRTFEEFASTITPEQLQLFIAGLASVNKPADNGGE